MLCSPFMPFIVLFCRIVETSDSVHLDKLAAVVETLQMAPTDRLPEAYSKQLRIFKLMYDVAYRYVEAKKKEKDHEPSNHTGRHGPDYDFDMFMREAGFGQPPTLLSPQQRAHGASDLGQLVPGPAEFGGGQAGEMIGIEQVLPHMGSPSVDLGSWFDQSQQIMRLMEDGF